MNSSLYLLPWWRRGLVAARVAAAALGGVLWIASILVQDAPCLPGLAAVVADSFRQAPEMVLYSDDAALSASGAMLLHLGSPFTGRVLEHFEGSSLRNSAEYRDGLRHGWARSYGPDGVLLAERFYAGGQKEGVHRGWWADGTQRFECSYSEGQYDGTCFSWYATGERATVDRYRAGEREGFQEGWIAGGGLAYKFAVVGGRRYGLLPSKACFTVPYDETPEAT